MADKKDYLQEKLDTIAGAMSNIDKDVALQKAALLAHTEQDEKLCAELTRMNNILQDNTESLKEHVRRTNLLESVVKNIDDRLNPIEIEHIQKAAVHNWAMNKLKLLGKIGTAVGAVAAAWMYIAPWLTRLLQHLPK